MHEEILSFLRRFTEFEVRHIYREGNCAGMWSERGGMPAAVWEKVDDDRRGVVHEHLRKNK
uniref:Uncharacterized protein n=1 Tax=Oryza meridionalis TaxID=40149 RepID=A0A0E0DQC4_9ORYZ